MLGNSATEPVGSTQSLRTPRKLVQTTLSARVEPREEGKRHWTHRTEITPMGDLERTLGGNQKEQQEQTRHESTQGGGSGGGEPSKTSTAKSSATLQATSNTIGGKNVDHDYNNDLDTDEEDELSQITDSAIKSAAAATRQEPLQTPSLGSKRKRDVVKKVYDDDDLFEDMDSEEERQLAAITDSSSRTIRNRDVFATPAAQRTGDVVTGMPTPSLTDKSVRRVLFVEPENGESSTSKRQRNDDAGDHRSNGGPTTPSSSQEATGPSSSPMTPGSDIGNVAQEVMGLLKGQKVDDQTLRQVKNALEKHVARAKGLERGRDASRQALKQQEGKIAHLQGRIADLENKRKLDLEAKKKWKSGLLHLYTET